MRKKDSLDNFKIEFSSNKAKDLLKNPTVQKILESDIKRIVDKYKKTKKYSLRQIKSVFNKKKISLAAPIQHWSYSMVLTDKNKEIIIKFGGTVIGDAPKFAIPTITIKNTNLGRVILRIQPVAQVDTDSQRKAYKKLCRFKLSDTGLDFACRNVGMLKNKPVVFDW